MLRKLITNLFSETRRDAVKTHHERALALEKEAARSLPAETAKCMAAALRHCEQALARDPGFQDAAATAARLREKAGDLEGALRQLAPFLSGDHMNVKTLTVYAQLSHQAGTPDDAIERMEAALATGGIPAADRMALCFLLGKLLDKTGDYDKAFNYYEQGNRLFRRVEPITGALTDGLLQAFAPGRLARLPRSAVDSTLPVYIVGMPKSGTTLVEQILASHPDVFVAGELQVLASLRTELCLGTGTSEVYPECLFSVSEERLERFARGYLAKLTGLEPNAKRITDKMPTNFFDLGLVQMLFPNARIIHCTRDPMDTCLSTYFAQFSVPAYYNKDLASIGSFYRSYVRLMEHWRAVLELEILEVRYESMVERTEETIRHIIEFCGLPWYEGCLEFYKTERYARTSSYDQVRRPIYRESVGRWRNYEKHLGALRDVLEGKSGGDDDGASSGC